MQALHVIERAVILDEGHSLIDASDLQLFNQGVQDNDYSASPLKISSKSGSLQPTQATADAEVLKTLLEDDFDLEAFNKKIVKTAVEQCDDNISKVARMLNISRAKLDYWLSKLNED